MKRVQVKLKSANICCLSERVILTAYDITHHKHRAHSTHAVCVCVIVSIKLPSAAFLHSNISVQQINILKLLQME